MPDDSETDADSETDDPSGESNDSLDDSFDDLESLLSEATEGGDVSKASTVDGSPIDDPFEDLEPLEVDDDSLFEEMLTETTASDVDAVWDEIQTDPNEVVTESGAEHIVPTRTFCAQCEYVSEPPDLHCTYDGSEIVEFVDKDHVRVRNCPIVEQRGDLSEIDPGGG